MNFLKNLPFEWFIALRYLRAGRKSGRNRFISFISVISMAGIALGVAALIIVMSVMNGFQKEVRDRMLSVLPHIEISDAYGQLPDWRRTYYTVSEHPEVTGAAPYVIGQGLAMRGANMRGIVIRGIDPAYEPNVSRVTDRFKAGSINELVPDSFNIAVGREIAARLHLGIGDKLTVVIPQGQVTPAGMMPRLKQFKVAAVFEAGHFQLDSSMAFINIVDAMRIFQQSAPSGLRVQIKDMQQAPNVAADLSGLLYYDAVIVKDWSKQNRNWFAAVQTEKRMMFIILMLIIAVATFNLVSTLVMTVTEKHSDIAILRTLGATSKSVMKIFLLQGALSGILGTLLGTSFGVLVAANIDVIVPFIESLFGIQFLPKDIYLISTVPSEVRFTDIFTITAVSVSLSLLATIYPSWRASKIQPAEALRHE